MDVEEFEEMDVKGDTDESEMASCGDVIWSDGVDGGEERRIRLASTHSHSVVWRGVDVGRAGGEGVIIGCVGCRGG